ncbi:Phosphoribosylformylglycinamidine synthase, glutamine amidotransferase subunit [hydrothermal vent metagenome]|uniref:Phosphoribosylformylglycinamidine synthase, glutamine amidotransferase subunit n=1 Tax=hydrothermal vent metagenome TaxID=652676 RepID=A0A3B1E6B7_9ZZZZ
MAIIQFPGTNCEYDTKYAFERLGANVSIIWYQNTTIGCDIDLVVIPGGFSYGDYLRSGALAKNSPIMFSVKNFADNGGKILGICNGFQILTESRLLPGALKRNGNLYFISKLNYIKIENTNNAFLSKMEKSSIVNLPIAHHDGNFYIDSHGLKELKQNDQILLTYCTKDGSRADVNGSIESIAGICNKQRNIFGLMPHPERAIEQLLGSCDGIKMLEGFFSK